MDGKNFLLENMVRYIEYASTTESMHLFDTKYFHTE